MDFSDNDKKECAEMIGLDKRELFNSFYLVIREQDLEDHIKDDNDLVEISENSDCYDRILIVWGHPFFSYISNYLKFSVDERCRFFLIRKENIKNFKVIKFLWPEFEGEKYVFSFQDEIDESSPEFNKDLLEKIFLYAACYERCDYSSTSVFWGINDILKEVVLKFFTEKELIELYEKIKKIRNCNKLKILILSELHNKKFLINVVTDKNESHLVIPAAMVNIVDKMTDINLLAYAFKRTTGHYLLQDKIFKRIIEVGDENFLDQNFLASTALNEEVHKRIRERAINLIADIQILKEIIWYLDKGYMRISGDTLEVHTIGQICWLTQQNNIDEQGFFIEVAVSKDLPIDARELAVCCISEKNVLKKIMEKYDYRSTLYRKAKRRIEEITNTSSS